MKVIYFITSSTDLSDRKITFSAGNLPASAEGHFYKLSTYQSHYYEVPDYILDYEPSLSTYMGLQGYPVNISSVAENDFLKGKTYTPIIVAIIDSGVDTTHEDLKKVLWKNPGESQLRRT